MSRYSTSGVLCCCGLLATAAACAGSLLLSENVSVEVVSSLTTEELWNSTAPRSVSVGSIVVNYRYYDDEAPPIKDSWRGCGIIMVGTSDLGMQPIALRVWTVTPCDITIALGPAYGPQDDAQFVLRVEPQETFIIRVTPDLKVFLADKLLGEIRD